MVPLFLLAIGAIFAWLFFSTGPNPHNLGSVPRSKPVVSSMG